MLRLIPGDSPVPNDPIYGIEALHHHEQLLEKYLSSHQTRNHSVRTIDDIRRRLKGWFESHGTENRPLYTWEAMAPVHGRERIRRYGQALIDAGLSNHSIRKYLGDLRQYFSYVLEFPYVFLGDTPSKLQALYHSLEQPVSNYDIPQHAFDGDQKGVPFDPEKLYEFYGILRTHYLTDAKYQNVAARNYAMVVLAGESGLRADELIHLEIKHDLFFDSKKIQTRFAKGTNGSGKRARPTLFTPLARDTVSYYLKHHRPKFKNASATDYLFISKSVERLTYTTLQQFLSEEMIPIANKHGFSVLPHLAFHWFRRIFATRFIERYPGKLHVLISLLGHSSASTVHAYIRHSKAWQDSQVQEMLKGNLLHGDSLES